MAKGDKCNPVVSRLILAGVAVHITTDLVTQALYDIRQLIKPLRDEIIQVIGGRGWKQTCS